MSTSDVRVLIVEDDEPKLLAVQRFLQQEFPKFEVTSARSLSAAISQLSATTFDLAIVDMSLPTYDFSFDKEGGGKPQGFGGEDIARFIESEAPETRTVVLTQYEQFLKLGEAMKAALGEMFIGVIHYAGLHGEWRDRLRIVIVDLLSAKE